MFTSVASRWEFRSKTIISLFVVSMLCLLAFTPGDAFTVTTQRRWTSTGVSSGRHDAMTGGAWQLSSSSQKEQQPIYLEPELTDERVTTLFAWVCQSFQGDSRYGNLMLAMVAVFGLNVPETSEPKLLAQLALDKLRQDDDDDDDLNIEDTLHGAPISLGQREQSSLGAMGAGQWMGQYRTRPHALLNLQQHVHKNGTMGELTDAADWVATLSRGCRRSIARSRVARADEFVLATRAIEGGRPAPHSSLAHFRCVVEHEVRVIYAKQKYEEYGEYQDVNGFFNALAEAVSRYVQTTRMAGSIQEYRNQKTGKVIAFAHEVRKGKTIRGQWFYATDEASKNYVWFHSVYDLVDRAVRAKNVDVVDLGPSGTDGFSDLKAKYGFVSVEDWPAVADYFGPFWYDESDDDNDYYVNYDKNGVMGRKQGAVVEWLKALGVA